MAGDHQCWPPRTGVATWCSIKLSTRHVPGYVPDSAEMTSPRDTDRYGAWLNRVKSARGDETRNEGVPGSSPGVGSRGSPAYAWLRRFCVSAFAGPREHGGNELPTREADLDLRRAPFAVRQFGDHAPVRVDDAPALVQPQARGRAAQVVRADARIDAAGPRRRREGPVAPVPPVVRSPHLAIAPREDRG